MRVVPAVLLWCGLAFLAACGGGSVNTTPVTPNAPVLPAQTAFSATGVTALSSNPQSGGQIPVALPSSTNGFGGTVSIPVPASALPAGTILAESVADTNASLPSTVPPLSFDRRNGAAVRRAQDTDVAPIVYLTLSASRTLALPNAPSFTLTIPSNEIVPNVSYYLALYDPLRTALGWQDGFEGPAALSGTTLSFAAPAPATPFTLTAYVTDYFAVYGVASSAPAPTPAPSISPAPAPTEQPDFTLSSTAFTFLSAGATETATISDTSGYTGTYAAVSSAPGVATVSVTGSTVTVTSAGPGSAVVIVSDVQARTASIGVQVTTTTVPVQ